MIRKRRQGGKGIMRRDLKGKDTKQLNAKVELQTYQALDAMAGENSLAWAVDELVRQAKGKRTST